MTYFQVTYPSTHGVYEEGVDEICRIIHENGGQVYMDTFILLCVDGIPTCDEVDSSYFLKENTCVVNLRDKSIRVQYLALAR